MRQKGLAQTEVREAEEGCLERCLDVVFERSWMFFSLLVFITLTSLIDAGVVVIVDTSPELEQNPLGSFLIKQLGTGGLFWVKTCTTGIVAAILIILYKKWRRAAQLAVMVLSVMQVLLMAYIFS